MSGELLEGFGVTLSLIGVILGIIVTAGIFVQIGAPVWLWLLTIAEIIFIVIGVVMRTIGEHL